MSSITKLDANGQPIRKGSKARPVKYRARWRTPDGGSRSQTFGRMIDAEQHLATVTVAAATGAYVDTKAGRVTFGAYAEQWAASQPHRTSTATSVQSILRTHVLPKWGNRQLASIRPSEVQSWVSSLELAPSTVALVYGKVAAVFRSAVADRLIAHSPCTRAVKLPRAAGAEVHPMSPAEVRAMVDGVPDRYRALVVLLAGSGVRLGEACGLTKDRVDFLRRTIRVDRQLLTISNHAASLGPPKTPSSVRTIPVPDGVLVELARHIERYPLGEWGLIFTDGKGDPVRRNAFGHVWRRAVTAINAAAKGDDAVRIVDRTPHDLRHYAASVLIHQGASVKAVQRHLGHASATTTLDTYAHLWPDSEDVTRRGLEAGLAQVVSPSCHEDAADA